MTSPGVATIVIVDDEPPARAVLREFVDRLPEFTVVAECAGGSAAIDAIQRLRPNVVLLDIQMPEVDGFDVLSALEEPLPLVIMVTAHDQHALRAFDHHALDYVLKPVAEERLSRSLIRARNQVHQLGPVAAAQGARSLVGSFSTSPRPQERMTIKCTDTIACVLPLEIAWLEAAGNYVKFEHEGRPLLSRSTLSEFLERLPPGLFIRIHRSYAVNSSNIVEITTRRGGSDSLVVLQDDTHLPLGRSFRRSVLDHLSCRE